MCGGRPGELGTLCAAASAGDDQVSWALFAPCPSATGCLDARNRNKHTRPIWNVARVSIWARASWPRLPGSAQVPIWARASHATTCPCTPWARPREPARELLAAGSCSSWRRWFWGAGSMAPWAPGPRQWAPPVPTELKHTTPHHACGQVVLHKVIKVGKQPADVTMQLLGFYAMQSPQLLCWAPSEPQGEGEGDGGSKGGRGARAGVRGEERVWLHAQRTLVLPGSSHVCVCVSVCPCASVCVCLCVCLRHTPCLLLNTFYTAPHTPQPSAGKAPALVVSTTIY